MPGAPEADGVVCVQLRQHHSACADGPKAQSRRTAMPTSSQTAQRDWVPGAAIITAGAADAHELTLDQLVSAYQLVGLQLPPNAFTVRDLHRFTRDALESITPTGDGGEDGFSRSEVCKGLRLLVRSEYWSDELMDQLWTSSSGAPLPSPPPSPGGARQLNNAELRYMLFPRDDGAQ